MSLNKVVENVLLLKKKKINNLEERECGREGKKENDSRMSVYANLTSMCGFESFHISSLWSIFISFISRVLGRHIS